MAVHFLIVICIVALLELYSMYVNKLSQYMNSPKDIHWQVVKRVLRYPNGTLDNGLYFTKGCFELVWYSDANWALLLTEVGVHLQHTLVLWYDNTSKVSTVADLTHHDKVKHVEINHHFVRKKVHDGILHVSFVPSTSKIAEVLTKLSLQRSFLPFKMPYVSSL
ncbi:hypothetical protein EPI10_030121 [Gossypium australe]|uniref:Copia protein n=1 Tax=Gossypium australe TaxID=47621 RepID=A0A5B6WZG7_9ROSI|nr:hypothetical protein EPI10_030121 [Gossypium australe]